MKTHRRTRHRVPGGSFSVPLTAILMTNGFLKRGAQEYMSRILTLVLINEKKKSVDPVHHTPSGPLLLLTQRQTQKSVTQCHNEQLLNPFFYTHVLHVMLREPSSRRETSKVIRYLLTNQAASCGARKRKMRMNERTYSVKT